VGIAIHCSALLLEKSEGLWFGLQVRVNCRLVGTMANFTGEEAESGWKVFGKDSIQTDDRHVLRERDRD